MMYRKVNWTGGLAALAVVMALPAAVLAAGVVLQGNLVGPVLGAGHGMVAYQANHRGTDAKLRINLEGVMVTHSVDVVIQGQYVATMSLDAYGNGSLHLSTRRGDDVPTLNNYDVVDIYDAGSTRVLLKGFVTPP